MTTCTIPGVSSLPPLEKWDAIEPRPVYELIARYRKGVENFDHRLFQLTAAELDTAFLPEADVGRWPVRVLVGHLADADLAHSHRMRRAVGEDRPLLSAWDENAFIDNDVYGLRIEDQSPEARNHRVTSAVAGAVALIHTVRQWTGQWLMTLTEAQWARAAMHPEKGELTVRRIVAMTTWHMEHHARFLRCKLDKLVGPEGRERAEKSGGGCGEGCGCKH